MKGGNGGEEMNATGGGLPPPFWRGS